MSPRVTRRKFLGRSAGLAGGTVALSARGYTRAGHNAAGKTRLMLVGLGGAGLALARQFAKLEQCEIAALAEVDSRRLGEGKKIAPDARTYSDFRKMFDQGKDCDAVVVATPTHWNAIITLDAIRKGKEGPPMGRPGRG